MNYIKHLTSIFNRMDADSRITPFHFSLYMALFRQWNLNYFNNPIFIARGEIMKMSKIGSVTTYLKCLKELHSWNYIKYKPSYNKYKGSSIYLYTFDNGCDTGSVQEVIPYINNTNILNKTNLEEQAQNFDLKNSDMKTKEEKEKSSGKKEKEKKAETIQTNSDNSIPPPFEYLKIYFDEKGHSSVEAEKFYNYYQSNGWLVGGRTKMKDWKAAARNWILNIPKFSPKLNPGKVNSTSLNNNKNYSEPL
ncbi:MAG: hypothetical protein P1P88_11615 [Bacteroidales bacterium]|nr:hypothetical protein [Bacteroidales bacterium]